MRTVLSRFLVLVLISLACGGLSGCGYSSGWTRNTFARQSYNRGDYTAARRGFEQALMDNPYNADYAFNVAAAMQKQGDHLAAERMYNHALTLNPSHQPSYHALAGLLKEQGRGEEAQELISAWVDTQPYVPESYIEMAYLQQQNGELEAAEASLQQALRQNPRHARAAAQLGQVYERRGQAGEASAMYRRALAMNRYQPQVYSRLNAMQSPTQMSPGLIMAQQMPMYDRSLTPYGQMSTMPQPGLMTATPYTTLMPGMAQTTMPMMASPQPIPAMPLAGATQWQPAAAPFFSGAPQVPMMSPQPTFATGAAMGVSGTMPTTVTTAPMLSPQFGATMPAGAPTYAPQPVQLGAPIPVSQLQPTLVPTSAVMPVTSAF